ncbi:27375_t:CDS:2, partial [Dentiscutata erythropus]
SKVEQIPCNEFYMLFARQNIIEDKSIDNHFKSNSNKSATPNNTYMNYHKGYRLIEGLVENMILILYHTPRDSPTTPPENCTRDVYHLYKDWPGLDEINKKDPMLSYDPLDPMQVQVVYKDLKDVVDNLVQSIHENNEETNHLETKLVYYLERYNQILNPYDHKTAEPLYNCSSLSCDEYKAILRDVKEAIDKLHEESIVFADLRDSNILVDKSQGRYKEMLIDFYWASKDEIECYPSFMNQKHINWPPGAEDRKKLSRKHDVYQLELLKAKCLGKSVDLE